MAYLASVAIVAYLAKLNMWRYVAYTASVTVGGICALTIILNKYAISQAIAHIYASVKLS